MKNLRKNELFSYFLALLMAFGDTKVQSPKKAKLIKWV